MRSVNASSVRLQNKKTEWVYIGETSRQLKIRMAEHKKAWEKSVVGRSALADHLIINGHSLREGSEELLHNENRISNVWLWSTSRLFVIRIIATLPCKTGIYRMSV